MVELVGNLRAGGAKGTNTMLGKHYEISYGANEKKMVLPAAAARIVLTKTCKNISFVSWLIGLKHYK